MEAKAQEFVNNLLNGVSHEEPMDEALDIQVPDWIDHEKYTRGRKFFLRYYFGFASSYLIGFEVVLAVPTILNVMVGSRRTSTPRTAYRRYFQTLQHVYDWLHYDLTPGTKAWVSLHAVRKIHLAAMKAAKLKGHGTVSQRDIALTLAAGIGNSYLRPDKFGVYQCSAGDWEAYNHYWAVIAHFIGLEDRYNLCKRSYEETYEISRILENTVFRPCLENPPEYFEHMVRVTIDGSSAFFPSAEPESVMFTTKNMTGVPGYIYKESERILLRKRMMELNGNDPNKGVKSTDLIEKCAIDGMPSREPRVMYLSDYESVETSPAYKQLTLTAKYKLAVISIMMTFYATFIGRILLNAFLRWQLFVGKYFPYLAIWRFGFHTVFGDNVVEDAILKPNKDFYKPRTKKPWYKSLFSFSF